MKKQKKQKKEEIQPVKETAIQPVKNVKTETKIYTRYIKKSISEDEARIVANVIKRLLKS